MDAFQQKKIVDVKFPFHLFISEGGLVFPPHWHEEIELIYVLEGEFEVWLNNRLYHLKKGELLIIGSREIHYFINNNLTGKRILIQFNLNLLENVYSDMQNLKFIMPLFRKSHQLNTSINMNAHHQLERQILELREEFQNKDKAYKFALMARMYDLITVLLRHIPVEQYSEKEMNKLDKQLDILEKIFTYVEGHYKENIALEHISKIANFSPYHFTRFFKENTGMTFLQYLHLYRIEKAKKLLLSSSYQVIEIALQCGFESVKTFNRVFKDLTGYSPTQYKKSSLA